jgi:hypothetical protein
MSWTEFFIYSSSVPLTLGKYLFTLLPVIISFFIYKTSFNERGRQMVQGFSIMVILSHCRLGSNIVFGGSFRGTWSKSLGGIAGIIVPLVFMIVLYILTVRIGKIKKQRGEIPGESYLFISTVASCLVFLLSPALNFIPLGF